MRVSYGPGYTIPLPHTHPFPMGKYEALYRILIEEGLIAPDDAHDPGEADWSDLALVHTNEYLDALRRGTLDRQAERRLGLPFSEVLLRRSRMAVQGTIDAGRFALEDGVAANLAGGTHHAFPGHGEGYCLLNDVAVAVRVLTRSQAIENSLVVDLDVHHGNGTAAIFAEDPSTFTFSIHGEKNYPWVKPPSSIDVALRDGTGDDEYLDALAGRLDDAISASHPDLVFYLAGVDAAAGDRFGRLSLSPEGLRRRDRYVLDAARRYGIPITLLLSGGYAKTPQMTAELHAIVHRERRAVYG